MAEKRAFHKSRTFFFVSGILLIILSAGYFFWRNYKYKLVNKKLDKLVTAKSKGLYEVNYQNLVIDEVQGNLSADNIDMIPDSEVYQNLVVQNQVPDNLFFIRIPKLLISGVKTPKALLTKEISAHVIRIENPVIEIRIGKGNKKNNSGFGALLNSAIYRQLLGNLKSITADSLVIENAALTLVDLESKRIRYKLGGLSIRLAGIAIDSLHENDSTRILFSKEIFVHAKRVDIPQKNNPYDLRVAELDFNSQSRIIHTGPVSMIPRLSEAAFARSYHFAKDRFDIRVRNLEIKNISRSSLLDQELVADTVQIRDASFRIFRDKSYPHDSVDRTHDYPQESIMRLLVPVNIKTVIIRDSYIEYKEKNDKSDSSGKVSFFDVQVKLVNVTNMPEIIRRNNRMNLNFNASFLNATPFSVHMTMYLNDHSGRFQLDAKMGALSATALNPLLKPMALAELDKGNITGLRYHLDATNTKGRGKLIFTYKDLSVKLLKKDDDKNKYRTKVLSTLAAGLVMKKSNPQHGELRPGDVDYNRDIHRSIFNLMWKSLFSGIKKVAM
jgi:hypothetical protein